MAKNTDTPRLDSPLLSAHGISLSYQEGKTRQAVLSNIELTVNKGEIIALLGPSGAGKSSLLRTLAGLQAACEGNVKIGDQTLKGPHPRLGFVFQDPCLLPWLTLEENVRFGMNFKHQRKLSKAEIHARAAAAIQDVDLFSARKRYPEELSGGMAQRTSLARTLARRPEILLLDEPFSALDEVTRRDMQARLLSLSAKYNTAAILVTHDIDEALIVADRIVLIGGQPSCLVGEWQTVKPAPSTNPLGHTSNGSTAKNKCHPIAGETKLSSGSVAATTSRQSPPLSASFKEALHNNRSLRQEILGHLEALSTRRRTSLAVAA